MEKKERKKKEAKVEIVLKIKKNKKNWNQHVYDDFTFCRYLRISVFTASINFFYS